jgi:putative ABC transport system substrate-binding protein
MNVFSSKLSSDNRKSAIQNPKWVGIFAIVFAFGGVEARAQQPTKILRIGYLSPTFSSTNSARIEAFRQGLRELGYVEGKNIVIEYRHADGKLDRLAALATELAQDSDPVANGFVASLARPSGNITGLSTLAPELSGKRLELLKEVVPKLSRVAVFGTSTSPSTAPTLKETELAAGAFKVQLQYLDVLDAKDIGAAFRSASKESAHAVLVLAGPVVFSQRTQIVKLAVKSRLPAIYPQTEFTEAGGLMYYGANTPDMYRRAAVYVDKILKGAKPADLPVEQPTKFEFVINLKTAKQIDLTIPPNVLARADKVIK